MIVLSTEIAKNKHHTQSLIVAPNTVVDHWLAEIKKYFNPNVLKPTLINGELSLK